MMSGIVTVSGLPVEPSFSLVGVANPMACSSTAELTTVNRPVAGSNPATPVDNHLRMGYDCLIQHIYYGIKR